MSLRKRKQNVIHELRVLLVVPEVSNINSSPEVAYLTNLQHIKVQVMPGYIPARALYEAVDGRSANEKIHIIHLAVESDPDFISLNGDKLRPEDVGQIATLAQPALVFFNSCHSGRFGSYLVQHGVPWAISLNTKLLDSEAWKTPLLFYRILSDQIEETGTYNIAKAFNDATTGDGTYGITSAYDRVGVMPLQQKVEQLQRWVIGMMVIGILTWVSFFAWVVWRG